jgi:hypothetical protein
MRTNTKRPEISLANFPYRNCITCVVLISLLDFVKEQMRRLQTAETCSLTAILACRVTGHKPNEQLTEWVRVSNPRFQQTTWI